LEYSGYGIYYSTDWSTAHDFTLKNSKIRYSGSYGVRAYGHRQQSSIVLEDNEITGVESNAIYIWDGSQASVTIKRNKISDSNGGGVNFSSMATVIFEDNELTNNKNGSFEARYFYGDVSVKDNVFKNNGDGYVRFYHPYQIQSFDSDAVMSILVEGNSIIEEDTDRWGGRLEFSNIASAVDILIQNNTIENRSTAINISGDFNNKVKILGNSIKGTKQGETGIYLSQKVTGTIENNTIENKQNGIYVQYSDANGDGSGVIKGNVIKGNSGYGIKVESYAKPVISLNDIEKNSGYFVDNQTLFSASHPTSCCVHPP
jgi:parallel beta-helix repeat protein